jgi:hypothetical protein
MRSRAQVTLIGKGFGTWDSGPEASIGGRPCVKTTWISPHRISCVVPHEPSGTASTSVELKLGANKASHSGFLLGAVSLASVTPSHGSTRGGVRITMRGSNFGTNATEISATIGGLQCVNAVRSSQHSLTCTAPAGVGKDLEVAVRVGETSALLPAAFSYNLPLVAAVRPATGSTIGVVITVSGENFGTTDEQPTVELVQASQRTPCMLARWISDSQLRCSVPAGLVGEYGVRVSVAGNVGLRLRAYRVQEPRILAVVPMFGPAFGGNVVTIHGHHFGMSDPGASIRIGTAVCSSVVWESDNELSCVPAAASAGVYDVNVTLLGSSRHTTIFRAGYALKPPRVTSVSPSTIAAAGGDMLTIHGQYFGDSTRVAAAPLVDVHGQDCVVHDWHDTMITCKLDRGTAGWVDVYVAIEGNTGIAPRSLLMAGPQITSVRPRSISCIGGSRITVHGKFFGRHDSKPVITIGGVKCDRVRWVSDEELTCVPPILSHAGPVQVRCCVRFLGRLAAHAL